MIAVFHAASFTEHTAHKVEVARHAEITGVFLKADVRLTSSQQTSEGNTQEDGETEPLGLNAGP